MRQPLLCSYAGQLVMSGLLQLQVKGWARMIGTRLFALAPALTVAIVSNVSLAQAGCCARCVAAYRTGQFGWSIIQSDC